MEKIKTYRSLILYVEGIEKIRPDKLSHLDQVLSRYNLTRDLVRSSSTTVAWDDWVKISEEIFEGWGEADFYIKQGRIVMGVETINNFNKMFSLVAGPISPYKLACSVLGPSIFTVAKFDLEKFSEKKIRVTISVSEDYQVHESFFYTYQGVFECLTRSFGMRYALVHLKVLGKKAIYDISLPPSRTLFARFTRAIQFFFDDSSVVDELVDYQKAVDETQNELQKVQKVISEQLQEITTIEKLASLKQLSMLGQIGAGLAHEINNPLTIINLNLHFLKKQYPEIVELPQLKKMEEGMKRVQRIGDSMRYFISGSSEKKIASCVFNDVLDSVKEQVQLQASELGCDFVTSGDDLVIKTSKEDLSMAITMITHNFFDEFENYTDGKNIVYISIEQVNEKYLIEVKGRGDLIPKEITIKMFEPFFTTKLSKKRIGLGLSIADGAVKKCSGQLDYYHDQQNKMNVFRITLPVV